MSYQVLARKWRPQNFKQMVGQEHVLRALMNALDSDRLHHAYLFTGTRGVGKTTIARILAKCLNCETGITSTPCGECNSCKEIVAGNFLDLIEVDAASRTKVEDTRELLENVQYAPTRARFKVYLIDEVHMLTGHSFNALLKTLEEPPPHVKFLFATTDPQKLPATILSRCLQFNLKRMPVDMITGHLDYLLQQESIKFEADSLRLLARAADGSMRDALSLLDQSIAFSGNEITEASVRDMLGTISHEPLIELLEMILAGEGAALLKQVDDLSSVTPDFAVATDALIMLLHQLAVQQVVPESINEEPRIAELANKITKEEVQLFYQIALQGRRDLPLSPNPRSGFEMLLLRMMSFRPLREGMVLEQSKLPQLSQIDVAVEGEIETDSSKKKTVTSEAPAASNNQLIEPIERTSQDTFSSNDSVTKTPESISPKPENVQLAPEKAASNSSANSIVPPWEDIPSFLEQDFKEGPSKESSLLESSKEKNNEGNIISSAETSVEVKQKIQDKQPLTEVATEQNLKSTQDQNLPEASPQVQNQTVEDDNFQEIENKPPTVITDVANASSNNNIEDLILQTDHEYGSDAIQSDLEQDAENSSIEEANQPWHEIVPKLNLSGRANELIKHCLLASHEKGTIALQLNKDSEGLLAESTQQEIHDALIHLFGPETRLQLTVAEAPYQPQFSGQDTANNDSDYNGANNHSNNGFDKNLETPAQRSSRKVTEIQQQAEKNIQTDPFVVELQNRFGAQLVPGSVHPKSR